jgi:hypothetical protein
LTISWYLASGIFGICFKFTYNRTRTHLSLNKDSPVSRAIEPFGRILPVPILGGLHHRYVEIVGTTNKSSEVWLRRNVFQPCDGGLLFLAIYLATARFRGIRGDRAPTSFGAYVLKYGLSL